MGLPSTPLVRCLVLLVNALGAVGAQQAFRTQPRNVTVGVGSTAVLRCEVLRPAGAVQWAKDGLLLGPQRDLPGFPRYSVIGQPKRGQFHLQIEKAELEDDSPYECQVGQAENSRAIVSNTVWINVQVPPSKPYFLLESSEPWVAGKKYSVTCVAPDAKPEAEITLYKDGVELTDAESFTTSGSQEKLENTHAEVTVLALSSDNGRQLVCRALNPALSQPVEAHLVMSVYFPPQAPVIQGLSREEVPAGKTLRLVCVSQGGNPLAVVHWTKNGEVLSTSWEEDVEARRSSSPLTLQVRPEDNQALLVCESVNQVSPAPLALRRRLTVHFEPKEVKVLGSFKAVEGQEVKLCCHTSSSNPPVQLRWWLGFRELNASLLSLDEGEHGGRTSMSNLTHRVSREENGLPLTCEAFNQGTRFSKSKTTNLNVLYPPQKVWLEAPPPDVPLRSGMTVRLVCFSSGGNPTGSLTWYKNGKAVPEASRQMPSDKGVSRELALVLEPSDNQATYRCTATNDAKKAVSAQTKLLVQFPAVSVKIVASKEVLRKGETLSLECQTGSSNPRANISWSLGPLRLQGVQQAPEKAEFGGVSVRSGLSLRVDWTHHGQRVTCHAFSPLLGEAANTFHTLSVLYAPEFSPDQTKLVRVAEDDVAALPLLVSANPAEISCSWSRHKQPVKEGDPRYARPDAAVLEIANVSRRDAGVYVAQCANEQGASRTSILLDVQYAPSVKAKVDPVLVDVGGTADLQCVANANPVTHDMFSWKWLGEGEVSVGEEAQDEETGLLTVFQASRAHAGSYRCTADNGIAPPASAEVQLVVRFKPELQKGPQWGKVASRGDGSSSAEVVCRAEGLPRVSFIWDKNGRTIDFSNPRYEERTVREGTTYTSVVKVVNVSAALDYAVFTCTARNALGEDSLDIRLLSTNHPDPPSGLRLVQLTHDSVTLDWVPGFDGGLRQRFRVRYRWAESASFLYVDVFPPGANVFTVGRLAPATAYNLSVNALNAMGESDYDAVLAVTTREGPEPEQDTEDDSSTSQNARGMPTSVAATLAVGVLLLANSLGCFLGLAWKKRRGQTEGKEDSVWDGQKSQAEGSSLSTASSRYTAREKVNPAALRTLLVDSGSEAESCVYESYAGESSHYYYPTGGYRPSLPPHPEGARAHEAVYPGERLGHEYEEVRDWGVYQDVLPPPPLYGPPRLPEQGSDWRPPPMYPHPQGGRVDWTSGYQPIGAKDRVAEGPPPRREYDLPFELRGELV